MKDHILTCVQCGNSAVTKQAVRQGFDVYSVECQHCAESGRVSITPEFKDSDVADYTEVRNGNFAFLSEEGLDLLRENMDDFEWVNHNA